MSKLRKPYECTKSRGGLVGLRARAWWKLRLDGVTTIPAILSTVSRKDETGATTNLHSYFKALIKAGYLGVARNGTRGENRYTLLNNTGYCPPIWRRSRCQVYDQNTQAVIDISGGGDA